MNRPFSWKRFLPKIPGVHWYRCVQCHGLFLLIEGGTCPLCGGLLKRVNGDML